MKERGSLSGAPETPFADWAKQEVQKPRAEREWTRIERPAPKVENAPVKAEYLFEKDPIDGRVVAKIPYPTRDIDGDREREKATLARIKSYGWKVQDRYEHSANALASLLS